MLISMLSRNANVNRNIYAILIDIDRGTAACSYEEAEEVVAEYANATDDCGQVWYAAGVNVSK